MLCDREEKAASLLELKKKSAALKLSCIVLFVDFSDAFEAKARACRVEVLKLEQLMVSGTDPRKRRPSL